MDQDCRYSDARWKYQEMPQTALPPHVRALKLSYARDTYLP
jgi:hypothetical protein